MNKKKLGIVGTLMIMLGGISYELVPTLADELKCNELIIELESEYDAKTLTPYRAAVFKEIRKEGGCPLNISPEIEARIAKADTVLTNGRSILFYDRATFDAKKEEIKGKLKSNGTELILEADINDREEIDGTVEIAMEELGTCTVTNYDPKTDNVYDIILNNKCNV